MYVVEHYWHSVAWCFCEANISRNYCLKHLCAKKAAKVGGDLLRERGAIIVHREKNPLYREGRINCSAQSHQRIQKLGNAFQCEILALDWDEDGIACREGIQSEKVERRRTIDQHVVVARLNICHQSSQLVLAIFHVHELDRCADEIFVRRD
jgi:hypothetical protein